MEMEPHFRNYYYQINRKFQEKASGCYFWKWKKKKVNTNYFSETTRVDYPEPSVQ